MGACMSIHHKASANKPVIHSAQSNGQFSVMDGHVAVKPQLPPSQLPPTFSNYGSKEVFFDSQAWLDSDYEDEFMSVNGDFTPSRGNTPVHHSLVPSRPNGSMVQPSPTLIKKKKRLLDFFKESLRENDGSFNQEFVEPLNNYGDAMTSKKDRLRLKSSSSMHGCFRSLLLVRSTGRQNKKSPISGLKVARGPVMRS